jgi:hypothetical protein
MTRQDLVLLAAEAPQRKLRVRNSACSTTIIAAEVVLAWVVSECISIDSVSLVHKEAAS